MKIAFSRINNTNYPFKLNLENVVFEGNLVKVNPKLVKINATMQGFVYRPCDSCGEELELEIKENLDLFASDGIFKDNSSLAVFISGIAAIVVMLIFSLIAKHSNRLKG